MDKGIIVVPAIGDVKLTFNRLREYPEYPKFNVEHEVMLNQANTFPRNIVLAYLDEWCAHVVLFLLRMLS